MKTKDLKELNALAAKISDLCSPIENTQNTNKVYKYFALDTPNVEDTYPCWDVFPSEEEALLFCEVNGYSKPTLQTYEQVVQEAEADYLSDLKEYLYGLLENCNY